MSDQHLLTPHALLAAHSQCSTDQWVMSHSLASRGTGLLCAYIQVQLNANSHHCQQFGNTEFGSCGFTVSQSMHSTISGASREFISHILAHQTAEGMCTLWQRSTTQHHTQTPHLIAIKLHHDTSNNVSYMPPNASTRRAPAAVRASAYTTQLPHTRIP